VTLETGGKSSALVFWALPSTRCREYSSARDCANTGQACCISSRIHAPAERYDEVVMMVTDTIATAKQGDPFEEGHHLWSCRHQVAVRHGHGSCGLPSRRGASATTGGRAAVVPVDYFLGPTVVAGVTPDMRIAREEICEQHRSRHEHKVEGLAAYLTYTSIHRNTRNQS
jgi:aldehyde dehydrogenase (NAD+)